VTWIILRTDARKEAYVARQIINAGFEAWVPVQIIAARTQASRRFLSKPNLCAIRELPILPRRIFASVPAALHAELEGIRHLVAIERNADQEAISVPANQIHAFRVTIDNENTAALALSQTASRRQKKKWKSLHDGLIEMIEGAKQTMEQAA
jgi:hypothetical protein